MKGARPKADTRALRQQAEKKFHAHHPPAKRPQNETDTRALFHELQVHQIELEMQNEELRRAQAETQQATNKYIELFDFAPGGCFVLDSHDVIREVNLAGAALLGLDRQRVTGRHFPQYVAPDSRVEFSAFCQSVRLDGGRRSCEMRLLRHGLDPCDVLLEATQAETEPAQTGGCRLAVTDITARKQMEDALRFLAQCGASPASEGFFRELARYLAHALGMDFVCIDRLEHGNLAARTVAMFDQGKFLDNVCYTLKDTPCGDVVGQRICVFPQHVRRLFPKDEVLQQMRAESYLGTTLWSAEGKPIGLIAVIGRRPLADTRLGQAILQLVAVRAAGELERQQTAEALQAAHERMATILRSITDAFFVLGRDWRFTYVNPQTERLLRAPAAELLGRNVWDLFSGAAAFRRRYEQALASGQAVHFDEFYPPLEAWFEVHAYPSADGLSVYFRDATERMRAQEALRKSEERLRRAEEIAHLGSWELDVVNNRLTWSDEAYRVFGLQPQEFGATYEAFLGVVHPEDRAAVDAAFSGSLREGRDSYEIEHRVVRKSSGEVRTVHEKCEHIRDGSGRIIRSVGMTHDITERKQADDEIRKLNAELEERVRQRTAELEQANRILRMTSECNEALVRLSDEGELIQELCRIMSEVGGFRLAWVGFAEKNKVKSVRPIASAGYEQGYLAKAHITWADNKFGRGPTGAAIRTGKVCVCEDYCTDPRLAPWRRRALARGYRSSIALPLQAEGRTFGALRIYAAQPQAFGKTDVKLLTDLADNLSFGITALRVRAERDRVQNSLEQRTAQLRELAGELIQAEHRERRRIAQVLHDHLQQLLVGARYKLAGVPSGSARQSAQQEMRSVDNLLSQCLETARTLTAELSPPILYEAGLGAALKWLAGWFRETHGLAVRVRGSDAKLAVAEEIRLALFQGVRELLFNVVKHAQVKQAEVRISRLPSHHLQIVISDRGVGFHTEKVRVGRGSKPSLGLFSLRERLELLGGAMELRSAPGRGSRFTLRVPLPGKPG